VVTRLRRKLFESGAACVCVWEGVTFSGHVRVTIKYGFERNTAIDQPLRGHAAPTYLPRSGYVFHDSPGDWKKPLRRTRPVDDSEPSVSFGAWNDDGSPGRRFEPNFVSDGRPSSRGNRGGGGLFESRPDVRRSRQTSYGSGMVLRTTHKRHRLHRETDNAIESIVYRVVTFTIRAEAS